MRCNTRGMLRWALYLGMAAVTTHNAVAEVVTFDDLTLAPESYWNGPDPNGTETPDPWGGSLPVKVGSFQSGSVSFANRYNLNYDSWDGFAYSNTADTTTPGHLNQFSACTGTGYGTGSDNYGIAYGYLDVLDPSDVGQLLDLPSIELPDNASIQNAYLTNTTYAKLSMLQGDSFAKPFGGTSGDDPDWLKLTIYGTDASDTPLQDTVEFYLADYRSSDNSLDYIVDEWTLVDFSPLAGANRLYFNLTSTDVGEWGMNTPAYFAIDNLSFTVVPEPSTLAMLLIGGLGIGVIGRRRRYRFRG